jgi:chemotaxis protein methyltransferase CheR
VKKDVLKAEEREKIEMDLLLEAVYLISGYDYRQYMRSSVERRIQHRMRLEQIPTISRLTEKVLHYPGFINTILDDLSISVTEMFRDPSFFKAFREKVVPQLRGLPEIRIWHAGCATGEEAYSMAILMEEEGLGNKTKIYATDINENVLKRAESGTFSLARMQTYTKNYIQAGGKRAFSEYYSTDEFNAYFHRDLVKNVIFAQHNLVTDGSFNEFHVIICRNVMIYFTPQLQQDVLDLFHESLSEGGFLGLGNKETLRIGRSKENYTEFDGKERLYTKK